MNKVVRGAAVLISAALVSAVLLPSAACMQRAPNCVLEAENAVLEPDYNDDMAEVTRASSLSENITSGGKYAGKLYKGSTITWFFTSEKDTKCRVGLAVANAIEEGYAFSAGEGRVFTIKLNGKSVDVPESVIFESSMYCDNWQLIDLGLLDVNDGVNELEYTAVSDTERLNVDYLLIRAEGAGISEHVHYWKSSVDAATCTEEGQVESYCEDCGYSFVSDIIAPLGHLYGNYHYSDEKKMMVAACERCGSEITANAPDSDYFGEVFYSESDFTVKPTELVYEAEDAYVCTAGGLNNGESYIKEDDGTCNQPSGGALVENISNIGNYILFTVEAESSCTADLVFRMSNTMYSDLGIAALDPMSDYVYCLINGTPVDFTFVAFPGFDSHSYFEWRYVVIKNVELEPFNEIEIGPRNNAGNWVTMPNTDVLKIYTDGVELKAVKHYDINNVESTAYDGRFTNSAEFDSAETDSGKKFVYYAGIPTEAEDTDYVITLQSESAVPVATDALELFVNGKTVNLSKISLAQGLNTLVLSGVPLRTLANEVTYISSGGVTVQSVSAYTYAAVTPALVAEIVPQNDYLHGDRQPYQILEAEDAYLGDSVSSRFGVELIEQYIYENTGAEASNNACIGNFAVEGNLLEWEFGAIIDTPCDITVMLASALFDESVNGNTPTYDLTDKIIIRINGVAVRLDGIALEIDSVANYYCWHAVTVSGVMLEQGQNTVTVEALGYGAPNIDVLYVYR